MLGIPIAAVLRITFIDIVLSGDNAVVIAMAARSLPERQQKRAIAGGGAAAIGLRVLVTALVAWALKIPLIQLGGGLMLLGIAVKLLIGGDDEVKDVKTNGTMWNAITTIVLADLVMSLDNMLAVGGASHGDMALLLMGLVISMGIIMFCSRLIAKLMNKHAWLVYVGAGILVYTAVEMILRDKFLHRIYTPTATAQWLFPTLMAVVVLVLSCLFNRRPAKAESD